MGFYLVLLGFTGFWMEADLETVERAVVFHLEVLALAHGEEVAVLAQQVSDVDRFGCNVARRKMFKYKKKYDD